MRCLAGDVQSVMFGVPRVLSAVLEPVSGGLRGVCQQHRSSGDVEMQQVTPGMWRVTFRPHRHTLQALERPRPDWRA